MITVHMQSLDSLSVLLFFRLRPMKVKLDQDPHEQSSDEKNYENFIKESLLHKVTSEARLIAVGAERVRATFNWKKNYVYCLETGDSCTIFLNPVLRDAQPFCKIQVNQPGVWINPVDKVQKWINFFKTIIKNFTCLISSVDLCVHFSGWIPTLEDLHHFSGAVKRRKTFQEHYGTLFTGFSFGTKGKTSRNPFGRLYDKTAQLRTSYSSPKPHMLYSIEASEDMRVFNLEFSFNSRSLKKLNADNLERLDSKLPILWKYATTKFLKHKALPRTAKTFNRCSVSPQWETLSNCFGVTNEHVWSLTTKNPIDIDGSYRLNKLKRNLLYFGLKQRLDVTDLEAILKRVAEKLREPSVRGISNWEDYLAKALLEKPKTHQLHNLDI